MVRRVKIPASAADSRQNPLHCTQGLVEPSGRINLPKVYHDSRIVIDGILQPSFVEENRHSRDRRKQKERRSKQNGTTLGRRVRKSHRSGTKHKFTSRRKRKDRFQGVRIGEAKNPGPVFFEKVANCVPFEVTKVVECKFGYLCRCPTHRHPKKGKINPAMRRKLTKMKSEGKLEWKPVKYAVCQHANRAKDCDKCQPKVGQAHFHHPGEEKAAHHSVKLYAECLTQQQKPEKVPGELSDSSVETQPHVELKIPTVSGDETKVAARREESSDPLDEKHGRAPMSLQEPQPSAPELKDLEVDVQVMPPPVMVVPHPEDFDESHGDEKDDDMPAEEEVAGGFDYTLVDTYSIEERVISMNLGAKEITGFWTNLKNVIRRMNPLLKEVADFPEIPGAFHGSLPVSTYDTTHFSYIWKDVDGYNPGKIVDQRRRTEFFNYVRSLYTDHRRGDVNMDMFHEIMRDDKLLLPKYINADGTAMASLISRVNFVVTKLPRFSLYIRLQDVYINTVAYAVNCLTYRYAMLSASMPGSFKPHFHSGPASRRQRFGPSSA